MPECLDAMRAHIISILSPLGAQCAHCTPNNSLLHRWRLCKPKTLHFEAFNSFAQNEYISRAFSEHTHHTHTACCCWRNVHYEVTYGRGALPIVANNEPNTKSRGFNLVHSQLAVAERCSCSWYLHTEHSWCILSENHNTESCSFALVHLHQKTTKLFINPNGIRLQRARVSKHHEIQIFRYFFLVFFI